MGLYQILFLLQSEFCVQRKTFSFLMDNHHKIIYKLVRIGSGCVTGVLISISRTSNGGVPFPQTEMDMCPDILNEKST